MFTTGRRVMSDSARKDAYGTRRQKRRRRCSPSSIEKKKKKMGRGGNAPGAGGGKLSPQPPRDIE